MQPRYVPVRHLAGFRAGAMIWVIARSFRGFGACILEMACAAGWTSAPSRGAATEIGRLRPVIEDGGYAPGCDHGVPADVSWQNYVVYVPLLSKATGWLKS